MKKVLGIIVLMAVLLISSIGFIGSRPTIIDHSKEDAAAMYEGMGSTAVGGTRSQTHNVFVEMLTGTWCQYCPSAEDALVNASKNSPDTFYFASMIEDVNQKAHERATVDYDVTGYPTAMFDGGYEEAVGAQSDSSNYETKIDTCAQRTDINPIKIEQVSYPGNTSSSIHVDVTVYNDGTSTYTGYLRTYIVEKESRYNDYDGRPYHNGFLDYAILQALSVPRGESQKLSAEWDGSQHTDSNGNDFADINYTNIAVISAVFDPTPHVKRHEGSLKVFTAYYVDQAAYTNITEKPKDNIPPKVTITNPKKEAVVSGSVEVDADISDNSAVSSAKLYIDGKYLTDMAKGPDGYSAIWDTNTVSNGSHKITVKANDTYNNTGSDTINVQVLNVIPSDDTEDPTVEITSPKDGAETNQSFKLEVTASDNVQVSSVNYRVDSGSWSAMTHVSGTSYEADITDLEEGRHTIEVEAKDTSSNSATDSITITAKKSTTPESDTQPPTINVLSPEEGQTVKDTTLFIQAQITDDNSVSSAEYVIDGTITGELSLSAGYYTATVNISAISDGMHALKITATDPSGNTGEKMISFFYSAPVNVKITSVSYEPKSVTVKTIVTITADINDDTDVDEVDIQFSGSLSESNKMTRTGDGEYSLEKGSFPPGELKFKVIVYLNDGNVIESDEYKIDVANSAQNTQTSTTPGFDAEIFLMVMGMTILILMATKRRP